MIKTMPFKPKLFAKYSYANHFANLENYENLETCVYAMMQRQDP